MQAVSERVLFPADDGVHGWELWISDGTEEGTQLVKDIVPGAGDSAIYPYSYVVGNQYFFYADGAEDLAIEMELWVSDGTDEGTAPFRETLDMPASWSPGIPQALGDFLFLQADDGVQGRELWISDGTRAGTRLVRDIRPGSEGSAPYCFTVAGEQVFFVAHDGVHGRELWVSDGTEEGTRLVTDINTLPVFTRGDSNADSALDIADAIFNLGYLFLGGEEPPCLDAADTDDSGVVDITDAVYLLTYLFLDGPRPPEPGLGPCGTDPTADELACESYEGCGDG